MYNGRRAVLLAVVCALVVLAIVRQCSDEPEKPGVMITPDASFDDNVQGSPPVTSAMGNLSREIRSGAGFDLRPDYRNGKLYGLDIILTAGELPPNSKFQRGDIVTHIDGIPLAERQIDESVGALARPGTVVAVERDGSLVEWKVGDP